jgi:predicted CXXCH cytochrome family protein
MPVTIPQHSIPLASGGCVACHDPHSSQYPYFLVGESDTFCLYCHDRVTIAKIGAHAGVTGQCTDCHNPHMSDKKYLLR